MRGGDRSLPATAAAAAAWLTTPFHTFGRRGCDGGGGGGSDKADNAAMEARTGEEDIER